MSKTIAVWGSPASGKTTIATKLAQTIYDRYQATVILLYADNETPTLPVIFPNRKKEDMYSVGAALAKIDITKEDVVGQLVTIKQRQNFGFLGFIDGENRYTYPSFDETKVRSLLAVLNSIADFVVVDCTSNLKNPISRVAIKEADTVLRLASPDLKSISFFASQLPLYADPVFKLDSHIQGINVPDADLYMPIEEAKSRLHDPRFVIPYSRAVKQQMLDGKMTEPVNDKKYSERMKSIVEKVVG